MYEPGDPKYKSEWDPLNRKITEFAFVWPNFRSEHNFSDGIISTACHEFVLFIQSYMYVYVHVYSMYRALRHFYVDGNFRALVHVFTAA